MGTYAKVRVRFTLVPKVSTGAACLNPTSDFEPLLSSQPRTRKSTMLATSSNGGAATPRPECSGLPA